MPDFVDPIHLVPHIGGADNIAPEAVGKVRHRHARELQAAETLPEICLGFRGEALPSIGSVARLSITSRARGASDAHALRVDGGAMGQVSPAAFPGPHGARVEVRDLFYATPARLKFMKSERAEAMAGEALEMGAAALLVASGCPRTHSPSHRSLDPVWAQAQEAGIPVVFHVGGTGDLVDPVYFQNGLPIPPDFHGGDENFRCIDYMGIPGPPAQSLATMIFDGVFERFPDLRWGVIEQGAIWVPSWLKQMESAFDAFERHEERLQQLSMRPSEYVHRQIRFTPYPTEDVGWIITQGGADLVLFNTDFPHVEGGRRPVERFEKSLDAAAIGDDDRDRFYRRNFVDLMGNGLPTPVAAV